MGRPAHGLHSSSVVAASRPICPLAWRSGCSADDATSSRCGVTATDVTEHSDWRGGRAAASTSGSSAARHRAWRVSGGTIWPAGAIARSAMSAAPVSSASGLVHAEREGNKTAIPGHGTGRAQFMPACRPDRFFRSAMKAQPRSLRGFACVPARRAAQQSGDGTWARAAGATASSREGWRPGWGETRGVWQRFDAQRNRPAPLCGDTPDKLRPNECCRSRTAESRPATTRFVCT